MKERYLPKDNHFYSNHYHQVFYVLMGVIVFSMLLMICVIYEIKNKPKPIFYAQLPNKETKQLTYFEEPNLLPDTILHWASTAATTAYTFDFVNYNKQIALVRPYFTDAGWQDYLASVTRVISNIVKNQLFVNGVVIGTPVISNAGPLPGVDYAWRIQIPFLVSYQSANAINKRKFIVSLTVIRVPTTVNPQGIGIDRFVMV